MTDLLSPMTLSEWFLRVGSMTLASGAVLLVVLLLDLALARRVSARARLVLYVAVFVRLALPITWASPLGLLGNRAPIAQVATDITTTFDATQRIMPAPAREPLAPATPTGLLLHVSIAALLALTWALVHRREVRNLARMATPARPRVRELAGDLPVVENESRGPAVFGLLHPRIALPSPLLERLDDDALRAVLAHEAAHLKRRDPIVLMVLRLATFAAWPIIPAWIASWRMRGLVEQACDEMALADAGASQRRSYGEALLAVASWGPRPARVSVGMLAFGGGLAPRLRALRHHARWPRLVQAGLALGLCAIVVLVSGERRLRADVAAAAPRGFAPLVVFEMRVFTDVQGMPDAATNRALMHQPGDSRQVAQGSTLDLLAALTRPEATPNVGTTRTWLGGSIVNNVKIRTEGATPDARPRRMAYRISPTLEGDHLVLSIGWLLEDGEFVSSPLPLGAGESAILVRQESPAIAILLTPINVTWVDGKPHVSSPSVTLDLHDVSLEAALSAVQEQVGVPVRAEGAAMVSIRADGEPVEDVLASLARDAGLVPTMVNGQIQLVAPVAPMGEIERRFRTLGPPELRVVSVRESGENFVVQLRLPGSALNAFLRNVALDFTVGEINMAKPEGDPGSFSEGDVEMLVSIARRSTTPRRIVGCGVEAYQVTAADARAILGRAGLVVAQGDGSGCSHPSREQFVALLRDLGPRFERGDAKLLTSQRIFPRLDERASVSTSGPNGPVEIAITPHLSSAGLVLDVGVSAVDGPAGGLQCVGAGPTVLTVPLPDGQVLVFLVEAELKGG